MCFSSYFQEKGKNENYEEVVEVFCSYRESCEVDGFTATVLLSRYSIIITIQCNQIYTCKYDEQVRGQVSRGGAGEPSSGDELQIHSTQRTLARRGSRTAVLSNRSCPNQGGLAKRLSRPLIADSVFPSVSTSRQQLSVVPTPCSCFRHFSSQIHRNVVKKNLFLFEWDVASVVVNFRTSFKWHLIWIRFEGPRTYFLQCAAILGCSCIGCIQHYACIVMAFSLSLNPSKILFLTIRPMAGAVSRSTHHMAIQPFYDISSFFYFIFFTSPSCVSLFLF